MNTGKPEEPTEEVVDLDDTDDNNANGEQPVIEEALNLEDLVDSPRARRHRVCLFIFTALYATFFAGAYLSFGPMQLMLEHDGAFSSQCTPEEQQAGQVCPSQTDKLLQVVLISQVTSSLAPFLGFIADHFGALALMYLLGCLGCAGIFLLLMASVSEVYELLFLAFILIGTMFISTSIMTVQTGLVFQGNARRQCIAMLNNLVDSGGVTYLLLYELYGATGEHFVAVAGGYLGFGFICFGGAALFWRMVISDIEAGVPLCLEEEEGVQDSGIAFRPRVSFQNDEKNPDSMLNYFGTRPQALNENDDDDSNKELSDEDEQELVKAVERLSSRRPETDGDGGDDSSTDSAYPSVYQLIAKRKPINQLKSEQYICVVLFFLCQVNRTNFVTATARDFLASLGDDEHNNKYLALFTYINVASLVALPFTDKLLNDCGYHVAFQVINVLAIAHGVTQVASDDLNVQIIGFFIFSFYRSLTFSAVFSFMPVFLGGNVVGRGTGIMTCVGAIFGLINIPLASFTVNTLDGDFFWANLFYTLFVVPFFYVAWRIGVGIEREEVARIVENEETISRVSSVAIKLSGSITITATPTADQVSRRVSQLAISALDTSRHSMRSTRSLSLKPKRQSPQAARRGTS